MLIPDEYDETRRRAEDSARRFAAAVSGAVEGFLEAFEEHRVVEEAKAGMQTAGEVARAAGTEAKEQGRAPEMRELGHGIQSAASTVKDKATHAYDATRGAATNAVDATRDATTHAVDATKAKAGEMAGSVRETVEGVKARVENVAEEVKVRAEAVGETARRAKVAPGHIATEIRGAYKSWIGALVTSLVMGLVMAALGIITLIVLTIALVVGLNELVGDPAGTWIVAGIYLVAVGIAYAVMRSRKAAATRVTEQHFANARAEIGHVTAPVRSAFSGRGRAGF